MESVKLKGTLNKFYDFISKPMYFRARVILFILIIPLVLSFFFPLWNITLEAPQYPDGLTLDIFSYKIEGGNEGQHLDEINTLNHYIGMAPINREALNDLDWMPFALGLLVLLALRVALIGNIGSLIDLGVFNLYIAGFGFVRFIYSMHTFGHNLDPMAPITVDPFMPAIFGSKRIANFTTYSYPSWGTIFLSIFTIGLWGLVFWHLISGRRASVRLARAEAGNVSAAAGQESGLQAGPEDRSIET